MKTMRVLLLAFAVAALHCSNMVGSGSSTETARVTAMLYNPGGSPAASAKVCFYRHGDDPRNNHAVDSTTTDNNGNYSKRLDTGTYNILATLDTIATFQDSIVVAEHDTTRPPPDTLRSLGSISGRIELQGTDDPRTVFVLFMGSNTFTRPTDLAGNFTSVNMAKGKYPVTLITTLDDYAVMDTSFVIIAGRDSVIPQPIVMQYTGIPIPQGLRINYDTLKQIVNLIWDKPTNGRKIKGYNIYRRNVDSNTTIAAINPHLVTDTVYSDSTGTQDQTYEYSVAVMDTNNTEGVKSAVVSVKVMSGYKFVREIGSQGTGDGQFSSINGIAVDSFGNIYTTDYIATYPGTVRIQKFDNSGTFLKKWGGSTSSDTGQFNGIGEISIYKDSLLYIVDPGNSRIITFDLNGNFTFQFPTGGMPSYYYHPFSIAILDTVLFVTDIQASKIYKYTIRGDSLTEWSFPEYLPLSIGLVTVTVGGSVYFKQVSNIIYVYDAGGTLLRELQLPPSVTDNYGIAVETGGNIFVSDYNLNLVWEIDANGNLIGRFAVQQPSKIAADSHGKIYVGSQDTKIQVFHK